MFSFYRLVEALNTLDEDRWMKSAGINPDERYASQWKNLMRRASRLRKGERGGKLSGPPSNRGYSIDNYRNAQVSKKLSRTVGNMQEVKNSDLPNFKEAGDSAIKSKMGKLYWTALGRLSSTDQFSKSTPEEIHNKISKTAKKIYRKDK
jgi:hypothetical protein